MTPELNTDLKFVWVARYHTNLITSDKVSTFGERSVDVLVGDPALSEQEQKEQVIDDLHDRYGTVEDLSVTLSHVRDLRPDEDTSNNTMEPLPEEMEDVDLGDTLD